MSDNSCVGKVCQLGKWLLLCSLGALNRGLLTVSFPGLLQVIIPGECILKLPESGEVRIGGGLLQTGAFLEGYKSGVLRREHKTGKLWVESRQKRCVPL
jgi:hypothetical protein